MSNQISFELNEGIKTQDNYSLKLKGYVTTNYEQLDIDLSQQIEKICRSHFSTLNLIEALGIIEDDNSNELISHFPTELQSNISIFKISTVDAMEISDTPKIEIEIDPNLEKQKTKKGFIDKIKSIFKNN